MPFCIKNVYIDFFLRRNSDDATACALPEGILGYPRYPRYLLIESESLGKVRY